jgi:DNA-binding XRE family transcriptional regulator
MTTTLKQKMRKLPAKRRARVKARAEQLVAEEMSLRMLRKAMNKTQLDVAKALNVGQDTISRYEQRTDMLLSTLQSYVQAMGGQLDLIARFPNRKPLRVNTLEELSKPAR